MKKMLKHLGGVFAVALLVGALSACDSDEEATGMDDVEVTEEAEENKKGWFDATFSVDTNVSYSAGTDNDWAYGNQRKEFPAKSACYVRVSSTPKTNKGSGEKTEIGVTYRFTVAENCTIELSDGIATLVDDTDANIIEYARIISPKREKKASEDFVIFKYIPSSEGSVTLEIIYDDNVDAKFDQRNTIYFVGGSGESDTQVEEDIPKPKDNFNHTH